MFGSQDELYKQTPNNMIINIVGSNYLHESIISSCLDIVEGDYSGRLKIISLLNTDQLPFTKKTQNKYSLGLLNMEWMKKTLSYRPATVILVYDVRNKHENISWKDYENSIHLDISKAKKMDNYPFVNIVLIIYASSTSFSFDNVSEDKERSYNIKKLVDLKNIFYINGTDGLKTISKKLSTHLIKITLNYYRTVKKNLKIKKNNSNEIREKIIKYNIKLGVLSAIKNKRRKWKYFEEAYSILSGLDFKNYYYGAQNIKYNYLEIKAVADWLFFKIFYLKIHDINNNIQSIIATFIFHVNNFSKLDIYANKDDIMVLIEYYWRFIRYEFIAKFLEDNTNEKSDFFTKNYSYFSGHHFLLSSYNVARMIKSMNKIKSEGFDLNLIDKNSKLDSIKYRESKFFGKTPKFYEKIDPLTEKDYEFDENIFTRIFLNTNNINLDFLYNKLNESLSKAQKLYTNYLQVKPKDNSIGSSTMTIFFSTLSILYNDTYTKNYEKLKYLYKSFVTSPGLNKFPLVYIKYLHEFNNILILDESSDNTATIFNNLVLISNVRTLNIEEEK